MLELLFKDKTVVDCNCEYECINKILLSELSIGSKQWMVSSDLTMINDFGFAVFKLNFYYDKKCQIVGYNPSSKEYNEDVQNLSMWVQEKGWNIPEVHNDLVRINEKLWKKYWLAGILKSERLSKKFKNLME